MNNKNYKKEYYSDGRISFEGNVINGKKEGFCKYYEESGNVASFGRYKNDHMVGTWRYFKNGRLSYIANYKNGTPSGLWKYYNSNGKISSKGKYFDGKKVGTWKSYYY